LLCYIFKIEKPTKTRYIAMAICFPYLIFRILFKTLSDDYVDFGEDPDDSIPYLFMLTVIISSAAANIFNKKFLTGTKVSIVTFSFFAYLVAVIGSFLLFFIEQFVKAPHTIQYSLLPLENVLRAEEIINVLVFN
jgi:drug/metabolite transporter (DMT)-like permease